jgi:hypothetical protein
LCLLPAVLQIGVFGQATYNHYRYSWVFSANLGGGYAKVGYLPCSGAALRRLGVPSQLKDVRLPALAVLCTCCQPAVLGDCLLVCLLFAKQPLKGLHWQCCTLPAVHCLQYTACCTLPAVHCLPAHLVNISLQCLLTVCLCACCL